MRAKWSQVYYNFEPEANSRERDYISSKTNNNEGV